MKSEKRSSTFYQQLPNDGEDMPLLGGEPVEKDSSSSSIFRTLIGASVLMTAVALCFSLVSFSNSGGSVDLSAKKGAVQFVKTTTSSSNPNIVFLLIDDMGYGTIGHDESDIAFAAPFMNTLAKNGIMMGNYYSQEICSPARAALMTGRYPISVGMQYEELSVDVEWGLNTTEVLLPEILRDYGGYKNYMIGKWNLGHYTAEYLPTARGFDYFVGFMSGQIYHWSKIQPEKGKYYDFMKSDTDCYEPYMEADKEQYSTLFYRDRALDVITNHDFDSNPMFLYFAVQAVHDPFQDNTTHADGFPPEYFDDGIYQHFSDSIPGRNRMQYALSLKLLDNSMMSIVQALQERGQWDNTLLIVASDNGGCFQAGGRNGDLRGCKGSLYEGGVKVDSFVYSTSIANSDRSGTSYDGLMHVSDWFPTIVGMTGMEYVSAEDQAWDGVNQWPAIMAETTDSPREHVLYNLYLEVEEKSFNLSTNAPFAIRKDNYKLIHHYVGTDQALWWDFAEPLDDDSDFESGSCPQLLALRGGFTKMLFDLDADPNETNNLYNKNGYSTIKEELYALVEEYASKVTTDKAPSDSASAAQPYFESHSNYVMPWADVSSRTVESGKKVPEYCKTKDFWSVTAGF